MWNFPRERSTELRGVCYGLLRSLMPSCYGVFVTEKHSGLESEILPAFRLVPIVSFDAPGFDFSHDQHAPGVT